MPLVQAAVPNHFHVGSKASYSQIGSGALPVDTLDSMVLYLAPLEPCDSAVRELSAALRALPHPIIGRIHKGELLLDLRCLDDEESFLQQLQLLLRA